MPYIGVSPQFGVRRKHTYTATAGQTSFSGAGSEGATLSYTDSNFVDVYQNGVKLGDADYTSTSGTAIVLAQGASVDDIVEIIVFDAFSAADTVSKADGGQFDGNVTMGGTLDVTGNGTVGGTLGVTGVLTANAGIKVDNITIDGTEIDLSSGDVTLDAALDIKLDAAGGDIKFLSGGTEFGEIRNISNDLTIISSIADKDIVFKGQDDSSEITALTLDMSDAGTATFNSGIVVDNKLQGASGESLTIESQSGGAVIVNTGGANERVRITSAGDVGIGLNAPAGKLQVNTANMGSLDALVLKNETNNVNGYFVRFRRSSNAEIGSIEQTGGGATVSYNTSSDYRLKENVEYTFDATTRLKQLKPARFNFIGDTATVDGFLAHEVSDIVPYAISGKKDAMTKEVLYVDGDEIPEGKKVGDVKEASQIAPQGIDHSKLVPLLTKTLQEALTRIDTLEAEVKALKGE